MSLLDKDSPQIHGFRAPVGSDRLVRRTVTKAARKCCGGGEVVYDGSDDGLYGYAVKCTKPVELDLDEK